MIQKRKNLIGFSLILGITLFISYGCAKTTPTASDAIPTATTGLLISATTSSSGGQYAPKNVVAIWVTDNSGKFVKTLYVKAAQRVSDLTKWRSISSSNKTDAITGATRDGHGTIYALWNGTDINKNVVADGTYKVWMEMTENAGTGANTSFTFIKGAANQTINQPDGANFSSISTNWVPL
ncbi:MAG: DUF2271 domain-containing protein [Paludibacter sp.]